MKHYIYCFYGIQVLLKRAIYFWDLSQNNLKYKFILSHLTLRYSPITYV